METFNIEHTSSLYNRALTSLAFYELELSLLQARLNAIAAKNNNNEVFTGIEHFENEFLIHIRKNGELKHAFHETLHQLQVAEIEGAECRQTLQENKLLYNEYLSEEKLLVDLRGRLLSFAARWL